jgi:hypothetical protein
MPCPTKVNKLEVKTEDLNPQQIRLLKSINSMLTHIMTTKEEDEYFDGSSELLRLVASAVKKANFCKTDNEIEYGQQALEFCVDTLSDQVYEENLIKYDN